MQKVLCHLSGEHHFNDNRAIIYICCIPSSLYTFVVYVTYREKQISISALTEMYGVKLSGNL